MAKVALVTGAGRGIGRACALALAGKGFDTALVDLLEPDMEKTAGDIRALGVAALTYQADASSFARAHEIVDAVIADRGRLDVLVNNAGVAGALSGILDYPEEVFDQVMAVNTRSVFLGIKYAGRAMRAGGGAIVNIASVSGLSGSRGIVPYTASKHAVIGITKAAALELAPHGIRVNAVCPAPTATEMMYGLERMAAPDNPEAVRQRFHARSPLGRYGEPQEIAAVVAFLAGAGSSFMTGAAVAVDGGMLAG